MVITNKQPRQSAPSAASRSSSSATTAKATKRASLNVKPATSVPNVAIEDNGKGIDGVSPPDARSGASKRSMIERHDGVGPFADDARFLSSSNKNAVSRRTVKARPLKRHSKSSRHRKRARPWSELIQVLTRIMFILFSIYSLFVCPKDVQLQSPVCRGLDYYRRTVVDPYILPPLRAALSHPVIAPQIERAKPYVEHAMDVVKTKYHIAHDQVMLKSEPYVHVATQYYNTHMRSHVRVMEYNVRRYQRQAQPYINLAKSKVLDGVARVEPHLTPLLVKLGEVPVFIRTFIAKPLEEGKEKWVDPQVKKIVDKVHEMSASAILSEDASARDTEAPGVGTQEETLATTEKATFYSSPSAHPTASITEETSSTSPKDPPEPTVPEPVLKESDSATIPQPTPTTEPTISMSEDSTMDPLDLPIRNPNYDEDVEDIEFWEDLEQWLSESILKSDAPTETTQPPKPTRLTEEEKAEKKRREQEETAAKRKDITERHTKWEEELETLIAANFKQLVNTVGDIRSRVSKSFDSSPKISELRKIFAAQIGDATTETKKVLTKMRESWEDRYGEMDEDFGDKAPLWAQILQDIQWRFTKRKDELNAEVSTWVAEWMKEESVVLRSATEEVTALVDKAQTDLISDYAWLNDVTYRDWERYHKLMFRGKEAGEQFQKLVNGEITSTLSNPVHDVLRRLQLETGEVTEKFEAGLNKIRREGWRYILGDLVDEKEIKWEEPKETTSSETTEYDPEISILPVDPEDLEYDNMPGLEILIGKSKEQIQQAVLQAEGTGNHEEL
ncbi:hypothetical protein FRC14_006154 [Serendipita sp. 396]|nr:hypothetical protein FRC14_006154 [Serendipita sp. 396]KAG8868901.1 hypothetical protein FRC20_002588 [Serendipita sp. 405]